MEAVKGFFESEGLPFPPVPAEFVPNVRAVGPSIFGTREPENGLYALDPFVAEFQAVNVEDYLLTGVDGHGVSSWAMHYYLVRGPLALFLQLTWGSAFEDTEGTGPRIEAALGFVEDLIREMEEADQAGDLPEKQRMLIIESDFVSPRWAWVPNSPFKSDQVKWNEEPPILFDALMAVRDLMAPNE